MLSRPCFRGAADFACTRLDGWEIQYGGTVKEPFPPAELFPQRQNPDALVFTMLLPAGLTQYVARAEYMSKALPIGSSSPIQLAPVRGCH